MIPVPAWLLREEGYRPRADREAFLDRSILSFLAVLARAYPRDGGPEGPGRAEPLVKSVSGFVVILLASLTRSPWFLAMAGTGLLAVLAMQDGRTIAATLKAGLAAGAFTGLVLLPSALWGQGFAAAMILSKVLISVISVRLISATTEWASVSGAFKRLGAPDLFLLVFDLAIKYIGLLGGFALDMLHALKLRSVGRNAGKTASLSGVAGTLFLVSKEMAEEMYGAMECRGFTGEYRARSGLRLRSSDLVLTVATGLLGAAFFWARG